MSQKSSFDLKATFQFYYKSPKEFTKKQWMIVAVWCTLNLLIFGLYLSAGSSFGMALLNVFYGCALIFFYFTRLLAFAIAPVIFLLLTILYLFGVTISNLLHAKLNWNKETFQFIIVLVAFSIIAAFLDVKVATFFMFIGIAGVFSYLTTNNKKPDNHMIYEWSDALWFATLAATVIRSYFIEAYTIPTSSMEKSLLVGDFLFVSKFHYGTRLPVTPLAFPFAHNVMPLTDSTPSYLSFMKMPYKRLPSLQEIKNNDVVVFNYPYEDGRPFDKKENYIKRCLAIAGDSIKVIDGQVFINNVAAENPPKMQFA
jgi:signal peptidase I